MNYKNLLIVLGFSPKENFCDVFAKKYPQADNYCLEVDFEKNTIDYGNLIQSDSKTTQNFSQPENFVVLECVNRLLEKGYKPQNIILEKTWAAGHGTSGRLDICVTRDNGDEYLLIECKTYGKEFDKEFARMKKDGGQLFTYFKFSNKADVIMLYASELIDNEIVYRSEIVKIEDDYRIGDTKDFYEKWNKLTSDNGIFDHWVKPYNYESKALTINDLVEIKQEDSSFIFNQFLEILRHNVVSDKGNAFNRIFTLFLCKIYDEKVNEDTGNELGFQWLESIDDHRSFQLRLTDLYKNGMYEFLEKVVTDFSEIAFNNKYNQNLTESIRNSILNDINKIRLEKNNEFAIKDVYDEQSFNENAVVVKEIVQLLQKYKLRYAKKQQYLSDFFELLLTTGLKQESGQFFTPVPVAQFIIKSLPVDKIVEEKLSTAKIDNDTLLPYVMDYAAGSGHFVTEIMSEIQQQLQTKNDKNYSPSVAKKIRTWQDDNFSWAIHYIYGIEKDYRLVKVGKVGCYLHGDGLANVIHSDGLARFAHPDYKGKLLIKDKDYQQDNKQFDIIISNPPYSVSAFKNNASKFYGKEDFELYNSLTDNSSEIECLFVERTKQLLKDGGVAGVILPSSILSNEGIYAKAREIILQYFEVVAITELGSNTFMATGTNTVVLFLRRRNNYDSINLQKSVERFFADFQDVTRNSIEKPVAKYVNHVWEDMTFDDYVTLLKKEPSKAIENHEIYKEYRKKIKAKTEKDFWNTLIETEKEKLFYFILAYPQKVVLVKTGEKDAEKRFLGYEFSNRRGSEGIHPIQRGKTIDECTQLFDVERFDNPEKASTYIYKAFAGDYETEIPESLKNNISRLRLVEMLTFDRESFAKNISTAVKKKVKIESKWEIVKLGSIAQIDWGNTDLTKAIYKENGQYDVYSATGLDGKTDFYEQEGDAIILSAIGARCGKCFYAKNKWTAIKNTIVIKNKKSIFLKYLFQYVNNEDYWEKSGAAQPFITLTTANEQKIPLPPLEIQQKIISEIEALEKKENETKKNIEKLSNKIGELIVLLKPSVNEINEVVVYSYAANNSENGARNIEKLSTSVMNVVSARAIELSPDITVANVIQRVSGVTVERNSSGDGQYAILRGMDKRYNYTLVNGIKIPSPDNKNRFVPLDIFPAELLDRLEVTKALTADMEGDAVGGTINLVMKDAPQNRQITANLSTGYNALFFDRDFYSYDTKAIAKQSPYEIYGEAYPAKTRDFNEKVIKLKSGSAPANLFGGFSYGDRLLNNRLGIMLAGSFQNSYRGSNSLYFSNKNATSDASNLPVLTNKNDRTYSERQTRYGLHAKFDYRFSPLHKRIDRQPAELRCFGKNCRRLRTGQITTGQFTGDFGLAHRKYQSGLQPETCD